MKLHLKAEFSKDLYVLGDPQVAVVAFGSHSLNVYSIGDGMSKKGWHLNALSNPPALHLAVTMLSSNSIDRLVSDLKDVVEAVKKSSKENGKEKEGDMVALYGLGQTAVGPSVVGKLAEMFIDTLYLAR